MDLRNEDVRDVSLECGEWFLVEFDTPRARLLQFGDHRSDTWYVELSMYV